jgi:hypothetical protein
MVLTAHSRADGGAPSMFVGVGPHCVLVVILDTRQR